MNRPHDYYAAMELARALSDAQVARYHEDGFLCPLPALSPAEARDCRAMLEAFEASQGWALGRLPGRPRRWPATTRTAFSVPSPRCPRPRRAIVAQCSRPSRPPRDGRWAASQGGLE